MSHLDLKLENIFLDPVTFDLKIADFGHVGGLEAQGKKKVGTNGYKPPELHYCQTYSGQKVDIFNCGHILFTMLFRNYPFKEATREDFRYRCIINENSELFWERQRECGI